MIANVNQQPMDEGTRLAIENTFLAQERTQLSWVQLALALISFGFSIAKAFQFLHDAQGDRSPVLSASTVGILMIAIGLAALALATVQHRKSIRALRIRCPGLPGSNADILSVVIVALGIVALVGAVLRH